jgi:uncharacterized OB-fold protein
MPEPTTAAIEQNDGYALWHSGLQARNVRITKCHKCRRWQWYPLIACPACGCADWDWEDVGTVGVLHSWTRVCRPTVARAGLEPPYVIGIVELPQANGARLVAVAADPAADPAIGSEVRLSVRRLDGESVLVFAAVDRPRDLDD